LISLKFHKKQLIEAQKDVSFHYFTGTAVTNLYDILTEIELPHKDIPTAINAIHAHLLEILRRLIQDEAYQLFKIFIQINIISLPPTSFQK
jgi:hypothetical protein